MFLKIFFIIFGAVFLAELADKTQLVGMGLAVKSGKPLTVWFGSVCAYMVITGISVIIGATFAKYVKLEIIRYISALLFIIIGLLMVLGKV